MNFIDKKYQELEKQLQLEKIRSKSFNWNEFKKLAEIQDLKSGYDGERTVSAVRYANQHLEKISAGSSRVVFILSSRYALKIAKNLAGVAQNEGEVDFMTTPSIKPIFAKIYDFDKNYRWLVAELVKGADRRDFIQCFGIPEWLFFDLIKRKLFTEKEVVEYASWEGIYSEDINLKPLLESLSGVREFEKAGGDLSDVVGYIEHWGKTPDGRIVILDYGLSEDVRSKWYNF